GRMQIIPRAAFAEQLQLSAGQPSLVRYESLWHDLQACPVCVQRGEHRMLHLTRREVLQTAAAGVATLALSPVIGVAGDDKAKGYTLPPLPYGYDALEKAI